MDRFLRIAFAAATLASLPIPGFAQERALTLEGAIALAREHAPAVLAARARIEEARGRLKGASVLARENPEVGVGTGRRTSDRGEFVERELEISQRLELGGRRRSRIAAAQAGISRSEWVSEETARRALRDVATAFLRALHAGERARVASGAESVAGEVLRIAERRYRAGDVAILEVNLTRAALARARSAVATAEAAREEALGDLRSLLGFSSADVFVVHGDLARRALSSLEDLLANAAHRPDISALEAEIREAEADERLGRGLAWPDLGLGLRSAREENAKILLGSFKLTLPVFERGQGLRAEAHARASRLRMELQARRRQVEAEVRTAAEVYRRRVASVDELEREVVPLLGENETLSRRSYEVGQIGLAEFLLIRRETLDARLEYLERSLEASVAAIDLESAVGVLR